MNEEILIIFFVGSLLLIGPLVTITLAIVAFVGVVASMSCKLGLCDLSKLSGSSQRQQPQRQRHQQWLLRRHRCQQKSGPARIERHSLHRARHNYGL